MKQTFDILDTIEKVSSRNTKIELLQNLKENEFSKWYFETVFHPFLTYGVTPREVGIYNRGIAKVNFQYLKELRAELADRKISGNDAREIVEGTISTGDGQFNKWIKRMWERDLKAGISWVSIEKVFPDLVPVFELQLCSPIKDDTQLDSNWIVQPKFDGLRMVVTVMNGKAIAQSRNGKELFNVQHILDEILLSEVDNVVIDGELMAKNWNDTQSIAKASKTVRDNSLELQFHIFDVIPLSEWQSRKGVLTLIQRMDILTKIFYNKNYKSLIHVNSRSINSSVDAWRWAEEFRKEGYEGAVAKNLNSVYEFDISDYWLKLKFVETLDLEVIDLYEGSGKNAGKLGGFTIRLPNGETCNCGGGLTDIQRNEFWKNKNAMIGKIIEVKFQEKTKDGSLRFPVFIKVRDDK